MSDTHSRWHFDLHPTVQKSGTLNPFRSKFLHPTRVKLTISEEPELSWTSRDHRKHRHVDVAPNGESRKASSVWERIAQMRRIEYWNISWWVAIAFTLGSVIWVVNGFVVFLPFVNSSIPTMDDAGGWTAWTGATIFEFGAVFGIWEAWNRSNVVDFGWAIESALGYQVKSAPPQKRWIWFSTEGKYWHELGFLAAFVQFWAATIFWIAGWTSIPTIQNSIQPRTHLLDGVYWSPQVVGGSGFIISSVLIMLETQKKWYIPAPLSLGWHVGLWNLIGGIGFTLCGALGYALQKSNGIAYQSSLSTFWGSWAFLIGSVIQWYESVNSI